MQFLSRFAAFLAVYAAATVHCYKVLVFTTTTSKSHMISNGKIADVLADAGFNVTIASLNVAVDTYAFNYSNPSIRIVPLGTIDESMVDYLREERLSSTKRLFEGQGLFSSFAFIEPVFHGVRQSCDQMLENELESLKRLKNEKFDAIFFEQLFACPFAVASFLDIKAKFLINSCALMDHVGHYLSLPTPLGWVPTTGDLSVSDHMSLFERLANSLEYLVSLYSYSRDHEQTTGLFRARLGDSFPHSTAVFRQIAVTFVSVSEFIAFPRPIMSNVVYIGGLESGSGEGLAGQSLEELFDVDAGSKGLVFFSLGSNTFTQHFPASLKRHLIDSFARHAEHQFIVKLEKEDTDTIEYARTKPNLLVTHWAPQQLILRHPRLRLFVTHAGYNSLVEAANEGVPLLMTPVFFDQKSNSRAVERNGWGLSVDLRGLAESAREFDACLERMLTDHSFKKAAKRIQKLVREKPFSANELLIKTVQFVLDNEGDLPELRGAGVHLSFFQQFNLDLLSGFILVLAVFVFLSIKLARFLSNLFKKRHEKSE